MDWDFATYEYALSVVLLVTAMFGMGATLQFKDFLGVITSPRGLLLIIGLQIAVMPCVALLLGQLFDLPPGIAAGMVLVSALPGGLFSNLITYFGRGNVALSISATAVATVGCLITTVFVMKIFAPAELPAGFSMPASKILGEVTFCLTLPLILGMILHVHLPKISLSISRFCVRFSLVLLLLVIIAALSAGRLDFSDYGWKTPLVLFLFAMIALWLTYGATAIARMNTDDSFTIAMEVMIRNIHLGVLLKASLFPASDLQHAALADGVFYTLLVYGIFALGISISEIIGKYKPTRSHFWRPEKRTNQWFVKAALTSSGIRQNFRISEFRGHHDFVAESTTTIFISRLTNHEGWNYGPIPNFR